MQVRIDAPDLEVLRLCYEEATKDGLDGLQMDVTPALHQAAQEKGIDQARFLRSLELLEYGGYINAPFGVRPFCDLMTTDKGFKFYGEHYIEDFDLTVRAVAVEIDKDNWYAVTIAEAVSKPEWLVERIMEVLEHDGYIQLMNQTGPRTVSSVTPVLGQVFGGK